MRVFTPGLVMICKRPALIRLFRTLPCQATFLMFSFCSLQSGQNQASVVNLESSQSCCFYYSATYGMLHHTRAADRSSRAI
jgi:hypothetical protein